MSAPADGAGAPVDPQTPPAIRQALPADVAAVARLQAAAWRTDYREVLPAPVLQACEPDAFEQAWRSAVSSPPAGHTLLVAVTGGRCEVVGMGALGPGTDPDRSEGDAEILALEVDPDHRGQGHGSRLLAAVADTARAAGTTRLLVWVWLANEPMRAFLQSAGLGPDRAWRDRVVAPDGATLRQVRLVAALADPDPGDVAVR